MSLYEMFQTDKKLESEVGITLEYGSSRIQITRAGGNNVKYTKLMQKRFRPFRAQIEAGTLDPKIADRTMAEIYADSVILSWDNVCNKEGVVLECTKENIVKLFLDLPDLFLDVQKQAGQMALFRMFEEEELIKNSLAV